MPEDLSFPIRFEKLLEKRKLVFPGDKVFVACSGGPDSVALFHLFDALRGKWKIRLGLLHLNHGLRGKDSLADERFVHRLGKSAGVPVYSLRQNVGQLARAKNLSLEEAGHEARYEFFRRTARRFRVSSIALAHTMDDQAETVLMRILQGTGLRGLCGIRERLEQDGVLFIRPLLDFRKEELLGYLKGAGREYRRDASNESVRFIRNRIRRRLIPVLRKDYNPRVVEALARIPGLVAAESDLMDALTTESLKKVLQSRRKNRLTIDRKKFQALPAGIQYRVLDRLLRSLDPASGLLYRHWQELSPHLTRARSRCSLPRGIDLALTPCNITAYPRSGRG